MLLLWLLENLISDLWTALAVFVGLGFLGGCFLSIGFVGSAIAFKSLGPYYLPRREETFMILCALPMGVVGLILFLEVVEVLEIATTTFGYTLSTIPLIPVITTMIFLAGKIVISCRTR